MARAVHRRPVTWAALAAIALTLCCAGAGHATTSASKNDCPNVTQPKVIHGTTPILFVHGIESGPDVWDGKTDVSGTNVNPLTYIQMELGPGKVTGYTFDWSKFSGLPPIGKLSWVTDPPPADLGNLLVQAITCVASHAGHKVIIIAHSMGGLLTEYASKVSTAAADIAAVFTLGTPYQGSWLASAAAGQGPAQLTSRLIQTLEPLCPPQKSPATQPSPSPSLKVHRKSAGDISEFAAAIAGYCHLLSERDDPGMVAMRLQPPHAGGWEKLSQAGGFHWYPLAAGVQGVSDPVSPVRITEKPSYVGDGVVSPASQLAGGSKLTDTCQVDTTVRRRRGPPAARPPWILDAVATRCFHTKEPYDKILLDAIVSKIQSANLIPTAGVSPPAQPNPPPSLPRHWQQVRTLTVPSSNQIESIAISPTGDLLATGGIDGSSYLWNTATGQLITTVTPAGPMPGADNVHSLAFSPDGKTLAEGFGSGVIVLRDVATLATVATFDDNVDNGAVSALAYSPDGTMLAGADLGSNGAYLWNVTTGSQAGLLHTDIGADTSVAFSPDGKTLAVGGDGGTVLFDVASQSAGTTFGTSGSGPIIGGAFSPDGKLLATGGFKGAVLWNLATGGRVAVLRSVAPRADTTSVAFSADSTMLATTGPKTALWATATGAKVATIPVAAGSLAFSPHGRTLATTSGNTVILWAPAG